MLKPLRRSAFAAALLMLGMIYVLMGSGQPSAAQSDSTPTASPIDVTETVLIAGGLYPLGRDEGAADERPAHRVSLDAFRIGRYEVTNQQFVAYLNTLGISPLRDFAPRQATLADFTAEDGVKFVEGEGRYPIIALDDENARIGYANGAFYVQQGYDLHPVVETTWRGARDYCIAQGGRLPTEAEWEAAARGQTDRRYPWGDAPVDPARAIYGRRTDQTAVVGSVPEGATPDGVQDMAGSLAEWTSSLYRPYPYTADDGREDVDDLGERVTRGGDYVFDSAPEQLTTSFRSGFSRAPESGHRHIGVRCVFPPQ